MASSAADGCGGGEEQYMCHVPQQSRREKLRYHTHDDPSSSSFHLPHPDNPNTAPPFHHTAPFFPSSSSSSPSQNPNNNYGFATHNHHHHQLYQISNQQPFSLSLASSMAHQAPPPQPRQRQQLVTGSADVGGMAPLRPFTGYAEILNRSRYLEPARQLLEEFCNVGGVLQCSDPAEGMMTGGSSMTMEGQMVAGEQQQWKKTWLISMLDEVYRRYKLYYQQVQAVITSFESIPGLGSAAPYASMALKVMSKHFRCLKNSISDQAHHINKAIGKEGFGEEENSGFGLINRPANNYGAIRQPQVWRPQRGLPERAVAVLRAWLFEHFLHPYPTDTDKQMLAKQTGLTRNQVSNWFINARVRLWKPMVEEIHSLEMRQQNKAGAGDASHSTDKQAQLPSSSTATSSNDQPFHNTNQSNHKQSSKQHHDELTQMPNHIQEPNYFVYDGFSGHHNVEVGGGMDVKGNGGISLTLGLHQNNGICLAEPVPLNVVRRFGLDLEECSDPYVLGSFGGQDRQFDKEIGGHLLHDFAG